MINTVICAYYNFLPRQRFFLFLLSGISLSDYRAATKGERELHFLCRACCISIPTPESEDDEVSFFPQKSAHIVTIIVDICLHQPHSAIYNQAFSQINHHFLIVKHDDDDDDDDDDDT